MTWGQEDAGPRRTQWVDGGLHVAPGEPLAVTTRMAPVSTMVVGDTGADGEPALWLLRHTVGVDATALVERIDPVSLEPLATSPELPGGPAWPGGMAVHDDGTLHVVFGNHAHRLGRDLEVLASATLPRRRPYNSFVTLPDGHLVTKDFGGSVPPGVEGADEVQPCRLLVLRPDDLAVVAHLDLSEPCTARLSADGDDVYVVGHTSLFVVHWDGAALRRGDLAAPYRVHEGQGYGWDPVIAGGAAWFMDDGDGSERFAGTLRGLGTATAPLHLVRVDLATGAVDMAEVCGRPGGLSPNPPVVDVVRGVAVAYDAGNGVVVGFDVGTLEPRWRRDQDHGGHLILYTGTGEVVTGDHADVVVLDVADGSELARADTGAGMQLMLFPTPGFGRDFYVVTLFSVTRVAVGG